MPPSDQLNNETQTICAAFKEAHMENCKREIVTDRRSYILLELPPQIDALGIILKMLF